MPSPPSLPYSVFFKAHSRGSIKYLQVATAWASRFPLSFSGRAPARGMGVGGNAEGRGIPHMGSTCPRHPFQARPCPTPSCRRRRPRGKRRLRARPLGRGSAPFAGEGEVTLLILWCQVLPEMGDICGPGGLGPGRARPSPAPCTRGPAPGPGHGPLAPSAGQRASLQSSRGAGVRAFHGDEG